jgi:hypothetical protein
VYDAPDRRVEPRDELHLGVPGDAQLGHHGLPLGQVEALCLLLEVIELLQQPLFPSHAPTFIDFPTPVNTCGQTVDDWLI